MFSTVEDALLAGSWSNEIFAKEWEKRRIAEQLRRQVAGEQAYGLEVES